MGCGPANSTRRRAHGARLVADGPDLDRRCRGRRPCRPRVEQDNDRVAVRRGRDWLGALCRGPVRLWVDQVSQGRTGSRPGGDDPELESGISLADGIGRHPLPRNRRADRGIVIGSARPTDNAWIVMSTWAMDYELRAVSPDVPVVHILVKAPRAEVDVRQRHADGAAGELRWSRKPSRAQRHPDHPDGMCRPGARGRRGIAELRSGDSETKRVLGPSDTRRSPVTAGTRRGQPVVRGVPRSSFHNSSSRAFTQARLAR
jgi:hypothetical protein